MLRHRLPLHASGFAGFCSRDIRSWGLFHAERRHIVLHRRRFRRRASHHGRSADRGLWRLDAGDCLRTGACRRMGKIARTSLIASAASCRCAPPRDSGVSTLHTTMRASFAPRIHDLSIAYPHCRRCQAGPALPSARASHSSISSSIGDLVARRGTADRRRTHRLIAASHPFDRSAPCR